MAQFIAILEGPSGRAPVQTAGLTLLSRWLHTDNTGERFSSRARTVHHDIVTRLYMHWVTDCLEMTHKHIKSNALPVTSPWISPIFIPSEELATNSPMRVDNGGTEPLSDEVTELIRRSKPVGANVEHHIFPGMPHDFDCIPFELNNPHTHFQLMNSWVKSHYEAGQRRVGKPVAEMRSPGPGTSLPSGDETRS